MPAHLPSGERQRHLPVLPPGGRAELPALRLARQHGPGRPGAEDLRAAERSSRTSPAKLGPFYTTGLPGGPQGAHQRHLRRRRVHPPGGHGPGGAARPVRARRSTTTRTGCCSSTSPAATSSRTCSGGTRTRSTRSAPSSEAKKYFDHVKRLYRKLDAVIGELIDRYGSTGDDHRDERPRLRQLRPAVQPELLAPRLGLPRPAASARRS